MLELPTYEEMAERLEALETKQLGVPDLPMAALQRKLESDWQPDAAVLFGQALARGGTGTVTFAAATLSATTTVAHGLGRLPTAVVATALSSPAVDKIPLLNTLTWTTTTFQINGEVDTAHTGSISFSWMAA